MFFDTAFVRQLATKWRIETPAKLRQKTHPFGTDKDPLSKRRIIRIFTFLGRNGIDVSHSNVTRLINLCETAVEECKGRACRLIVVLALVSAAIAAFAPIEALRQVFYAATIMAIVALIVVLSYTYWQNTKVIAFRHDLQVASCNWEKCANTMNEHCSTNTTTQVFRDAFWIASVSEKWNSLLSMRKRIWLLIDPDSYPSFSRIIKLPDFLRSNGIPTVETDQLIELCNAAMQRTERISSYFAAFAISFLASSVFEFTSDASNDIPCILIRSMLAALIACAVLAILLAIPQRGWIRVARFKADLVAAKASGLIS